MNNLWRDLMLGCSAGALIAAVPMHEAFAQDNNDIEQVVVSASRITIAGYTQPTPVTVVGAAQLEQDAFNNITDSIRDLPSVQSPPSSESYDTAGVSAGQEGENLLNLRNLGILRTLVLFDGQRVVQSNITGGVDMSTIPTSLVSRVDIVTGGASAAWGSDAVAGVVNLVLNKNFTGAKLNLEGSDTYNDLYRGVTIDGAWGTDLLGGRGHVVLAANYTMFPNAVPEDAEPWFNDTYLVNNPAYNAKTNPNVPHCQPGRYPRGACERIAWHPVRHLGGDTVGVQFRQYLGRPIQWRLRQSLQH
jgi:outer membrane receptor protein involved in Fe transport